MPLDLRSQAIHSFSETAIRAAIGLSDHVESVFFNGYLEALVTPYPNDISYLGSVGRYYFLDAPEQLEVISASTNDTTTGTGAREIYIEGLDINYNPISEVVPTNGTTPVTTTQSFYRVNHSEVQAAGSLGWNHGAIKVRRALPSGLVLSGIPPTRGHDQSAAYTVRDGYSLLVFGIEFSREISANFGVNDFVVTTHTHRRPGEAWRDRGTTILSAGSVSSFATVPIVIEEREDYILRAVTANKPGGFVAANARGLLIKNDLVLF